MIFFNIHCMKNVPHVRNDPVVCTPAALNYLSNTNWMRQCSRILLDCLFTFTVMYWKFKVHLRLTFYKYVCCLGINSRPYCCIHQLQQRADIYSAINYLHWCKKHKNKTTCLHIIPWQVHPMWVLDDYDVSPVVKGLEMLKEWYINLLYFYFYYFLFIFLARHHKGWDAGSR